MSETANTIDRPLNDQEQVKIYSPADPWTNDYAATVVKQDFSTWAAYRQQNHDIRWQTSDQLFLGWQPQNVWPGTRVPRSSLGTFITMENEEAMLARVMSAIFPLEDNVDCTAKYGTTPEQARLVFKMVMQQLQSDYCNVKESCRLAFKQGFLYGNGILEVSWKYIETIRKVVMPIWEQEGYLDPLYQALFPSSPKRRLMEKTLEVVLNQPLLESRDIRDFYIDPNTSSPDVQKARGCAVRQLITKEEVMNYAGQDGFTLPSPEALKLMSENKSSTVGDQTKQFGEGYRGVGWTPMQDYTGNPGDKRLELIRYYNHNRCIWTLNRDWVFYNNTNSFGCLPFLNAFYIDVPGRFYGLSIADVCEPEQRLQQSIINARIDELALTIHAPFVKKRGDQLPQGQMRMVPGRTIELDNPDQFKKIEWPNITQQSFQEVDSSSGRLQKSTGLSDIGAIGGTPSQGNSANRTATGINTQVAVTNIRVGHVIENLENTLIEPLLALVHKMNKQFLNPQQVLYLLGEQEPVDPLLITHADVNFKCRGAKKMQSRGMLLQILPNLMPTLLNPSIMQLLAEQQGMTLDVREVFASICDAMGVPDTQWFRPMNPNELQMQQQNNANAVKQAMQSQRLEAQTQHEQMKGDTAVMTKVMPEFIKGNPKLISAATGFEPPKEPSATRPKTQ